MSNRKFDLMLTPEAFADIDDLDDVKETGLGLGGRFCWVPTGDSWPKFQPFLAIEIGR